MTGTQLYCFFKEVIVINSRLTCLVVFVTSVVWLPDTALGSPVDLVNPGAEKQEKNRRDRPAGAGVWTSSGVDATFRRDTSVKRSGEASFHIVNRGRANAPKSAPQTALFTIQGDVVPQLTYTIKAYVKTKNVQGEAGFGLRLQSSSGWLDVAPQVDVVKGTHDWTPITARFTAPPGANNFVLFLLVRHKGKAWFDDIEIRDNLKSWSLKRFTTLDEDLTQLVTQAQLLSPPLPPPQLNRLVAGATEARQFLAQSRSLRADKGIPYGARRRFSDEATRLGQLMLRHARSLSVRKVLAEATNAHAVDARFVVGFAPSTLHVFLEDLPLRFEVASERRMLAVRGEVEATQLVILAHKDELRDVQVSVSDLTGAAGTIRAPTVRPVGFVRTKILSVANPYPREYDYAGWWPDPLLENFAFDVKQGDSQPVWIEVHVPRQIPAGPYHGTIEIATASGQKRTLGLTLDVADVTLPEEWRFNNLLSWHEHWARAFYKERWNDALHEKFIQFLLERRINVISTYGNEPYETTENLIRFAKQGQNALMLAWMHPEARVKDSQGTSLRRRLDAMLPAMKRTGVLERCIVYGWDECGADSYDEIRYCAELLRDDYGGIPLLSAGTDPTYGTDSPLAGLSNIIYCPTMPTYDAALADRARANGNRVWWYETWWIIEHPLIRGRLIPWQSFKVGADGFLFWCLNRFVGNDKPVFDRDAPKIRTTWNPALDGGYENSTAMYVYPGRDGPISSLRLENLRDGIEDYELLCRARDLLADLQRRKTQDARLIARLRKVITLEDPFVKDHASYATDPRVLTHQRRELIKALEQAMAVK